MISAPRGQGRGTRARKRRVRAEKRRQTPEAQPTATVRPLTDMHPALEAYKRGEVTVKLYYKTLNIRLTR